MVDCDNECHLVYIRRKDMTLFAEVRRAAHDIIAAVFNLRDPIRSVGQGLHLHEVPDRNGIGTTDTANAEVAFDSALRIRTIVHTNDVTATRGFDD